MRERAMVACTVLVFSLAAGCAMNGGARYAAVDQPSPAAGADGLRVMSFNLRLRTVFDIGNHWNFRRGLVVQTIERFEPDLLGVQECLPAQADYLADALPDYTLIGVGRSDGDRRGEMAAVLFKTDRFEEIGHGHFWLSDTPERPGRRGWDAWFPRMVTWVRLQPRGPGAEPIYFFNTHFDNEGRRARLESARLLRSEIGRIAGNAPAIVTGDFNAGEDSDPYRNLTDRNGRPPLADTFRQAYPAHGPDEGTRHGFRGGTRGDRIDWILTTPQFETVFAAIDRTHARGRYPSDHFPVQAVLSWPPAGSEPDALAQRSGRSE